MAGREEGRWGVVLIVLMDFRQNGDRDFEGQVIIIKWRTKKLLH